MIIQGQSSKIILIAVLFVLFLTGLALTSRMEYKQNTKPDPFTSISPYPSIIPSSLPVQTPSSLPIATPSLLPNPSTLKNLPSQENYILQYSEGECVSSDQCVYVEYGCGGGHGMCTTEPEKYKDMMTTCEYNPDFPAFLGYSCQCITSISKCGWVK